MDSAVGAYLAGMTLWIYGVLDQTTSDWVIWFFPILGLAQIAAGIVIGRWWAVLLPLVLIPISVPAMDPPITPDNAEPFPIFISVAFWALLAVPLVAFGVGARKAVESRQA